VRPILRRGLLAGIHALVTVARIKASDVDQSLPVRFLDFVHDHRHGSDHGAQSQGQTSSALTSLPVADVMQPRSLDRVAFGRITELPQRFQELHRRVLVDEDTHYAAMRAGPLTGSFVCSTGWTVKDVFNLIFYTFADPQIYLSPPNGEQPEEWEQLCVYFATNSSNNEGYSKPHVIAKKKSPRAASYASR
jgi:hypothetical protein